MKRLLTILACVFSQISFGQFAVVADSEGFENVRSSAGFDNNVKDTLKNGQIVYCLGLENNWYFVDYNHLSSGYIHKTRLKFIEEFEKVDYSDLTVSLILFQTDSVRLTINKESFNPAVNKLQFHKANADRNEASYLEKINGAEFWGTDGDVPETQYKQIVLQIGEDIIYLPADNLFEPNLNNTSFNIDRKNEIFYISALNSDGAGGYVVLWIIEKGEFKDRIITRPF